MWWRLAQVLTAIWYGGLLRARVRGLDNVPRGGPLILAANHVSMTDPFLAGWAVDPVRTTFFIGKSELFRSPALGGVLRGLNTIPVDRGRGDVGAMRRVEEHLKSGGCLVLFPEGTRIRTGLPGRPKAGVGFLACRTGAAVVPARLFGMRGVPVPGRVGIRFGPPLRFEGPPGKEAYEEFAGRVMAEIFKLELEEFP